MPAIQLMSNVSTVSIRWRNSRSVPARISRLRVVLHAHGLRIPGEWLEDLGHFHRAGVRSGTIFTENPDGERALRIAKLRDSRCRARRWPSARS